jgi:hypothetical protein
VVVVLGGNSGDKIGGVTVTRGGIVVVEGGLEFVVCRMLVVVVRGGKSGDKKGGVGVTRGRTVVVDVDEVEVEFEVGRVLTVVVVL